MTGRQVAHLVKLRLLSSAMPTSSLPHDTLVLCWHHQIADHSNHKTDMQDANESVTLTWYSKCHCMPGQVKLHGDIGAGLHAEHSCRYQGAILAEHKYKHLEQC